jgi:hypothetical protein
MVAERGRPIYRTHGSYRLNYSWNGKTLYQSYTLITDTTEILHIPAIITLPIKCKQGVFGISTMILSLQVCNDAVSKQQFTGLQHPMGRRNGLATAMKLSCLTAR